MTLLLCKLALAPAFVVLVTLSVRRFGPRVGGIFGGLPVVAGPILFVYALDQGVEFGADAAAHSLAALVALTAFVLAVAFASPRLGAWRSVVLGWVVFCSAAGLLAALAIQPVVGLVAACATFAVALAVLPHPDPSAVADTPRRPRHDLLLRASSAAALVIVLTSLAGSLGPAASGVLAPFPTITSVLTGFAVSHETRATVLRLMRGMIRGFFSFAAFLFVLAVSLESFGTALSFSAAVVAMAVIQLGLLAWTSRGTERVVQASHRMPGSATPPAPAAPVGVPASAAAEARP